MSEEMPNADELFEEKAQMIDAEYTEKPQTTEVAKVESFPALKADQQMQLLKESCQIYLKSGLLPAHIKNWAEAFTIANYGRELGMKPLEAFSEIYVVKGKPAMSAKLMKARVHQQLPNAIFDIIEHTATVAKVRVARDRKEDAVEWTMTRKECDAAGFTTQFNKFKKVTETKDNWQKQPETMLLYRLISKVCRMVFPDCLGSISYTPEELGFDETQTRGKIMRATTTDELDQFNSRMRKIGESFEVSGE